MIGEGALCKLGKPHQETYPQVPPIKQHLIRFDQPTQESTLHASWYELGNLMTDTATWPWFASTPVTGNSLWVLKRMYFPV